LLTVTNDYPTWSKAMADTKDKIKDNIDKAADKAKYSPSH